MRQFKVDGEWAIDEHGWRIGKVFTEKIPGKPDKEAIHRVEFFDRRYIQSGSKILTALEQQEVGVIELGAAT